MPTGFRCSKCQDTGWVLIPNRRGPAAERCACFRAAEAESLYQQIGVPKHFLEATFDNFSAGDFQSNPQEYHALTAALRRAKEFADDFPASARKGLLLHGGTPERQTHLAIATLKLCANKGLDCLYCDYQSLLETLRERSAPAPDVAERSRAFSRRILEVDVLLLDSLGDHRLTDWVGDTIGAIIKQRYNDEKGLIVTTGYPLKPPPRAVPDGTMGMHTPYEPESLPDRIGQAAVARLLEHCQAVPMAPARSAIGEGVPRRTLC